MRLRRPVKNRSPEDKHSSVEKATWIDQSLHRVNFVGCSLQGATFSGCALCDCDFRMADLRHPQYENAEAVGGLFAGADLTGARRTACSFEASKWAMAVLQSAELIGSNMSAMFAPESLWDYAQICSTVARQAVLPGASFKNAIVT